jgi:SAM-dependent methyltransferase
VANPWYTDDCPNLNQAKTFDENMPTNMLSSGKNCPNDDTSKGASKCAYLCFSHEVTGVAQIPLSLWKIVQKNEFDVWKGSYGSSDRGGEHIEGFGQYASLPDNLGNYLEIGCGPYTQTQFIINHQFKSITLLDPGANNYIKHTPGCTYKNGTLKGKKVDVLSFGGEKLEDEKYKEAFDTILAINVVEHVWDAFKFFNNIYNALKPGGIVIYHDRFYPYPSYGDRVLGKYNS